MAAIGLLALLVTGASLLVIVLRSDDEAAEVGLEPAVPTTVGAAPTTATPPTATPPTTVATAPATVPATSATPTAPSAPPSTSPVPTTLAPTTLATVAGLASVLDDPLPSGLPVDEVEPSLRAAQQLADALAAGDWPTARRLDPGLRSLSDEQFLDGFDGLDESTLLLVDARRVGDGHDLLAVLIANERAGRQTTIFCVESTVTADGEVSQRSARVLERASRTLGVEDVRQDATIIEQIRRQCIWG